MGSNRGKGPNSGAGHRGSTWAFAILGVAGLAFAATLADAGRLTRARAADLAASRAFAGRMEITDLALFSEARYTRHLAEADRHAAFQDQPMALEHFPAGSLALPAEVRR